MSKCKCAPLAALEVKKLTAHAKLPTRAHPGDAGLDLYAADDDPYRPDEVFTVGTGVAIAIPKGMVGLVCGRSSLNVKGLISTGGVIDHGYTGEIKIALLNMTGEHGCIRRGERVAQLLLLPIESPSVCEVPELPDSERGDRGFGSTGI